jgi:DNA-binding transcriptional LysR family regulator
MKNLNRVHLNGLRALEAAYRLGSLQAAAEEFGVSVGAVSQQITKAEAQLAMTLFERQPKGLVPVPQALPVLAQLSESFRGLSRAVRLAEVRDPSILTISVAPVFAARWLVHRLDRFAAANPDLRLRIDATTQIADLENSDVDLAIRVGDGSWPHVKSELLLAQQVFPVVSPALSGRLSCPEDLAAVPLVIDERAMFSWDIWLEAAGVPGLPRTIGHRLNEASLCLDAVMAGQGVMLAWQTLAADAIEQGRLAVPFPLRVKTGFGHYLVTAPGQRERHATLAFKAWLKAELAASMKALELHFLPEG